nr:hepatitis A virus cellular receptor 1-like isoform X1 [Penaeus vannamei]
MHTMKHTIEDLEPATDYHANVQIKNQFMWGENQQFTFSTRKVSPTTTTTPTFTTTPTTTTFPTTTFVEDKVGPTSGSVQEVAGQQSTLSGSGSAGLNALLLLLTVFLLRT